jgi:hypothetical protein
MTSVVLAVLLLTTPAAAPAQRASVAGVVQDAEANRLPGVTVILIAPDGVENRVSTAADGSYVFDDVSIGTYDIRYELSGLAPAQQTLSLAPGSNVAEAQPLVFDQDVTITLTCGSPCLDEAPQSAWDRPHCGDYELNDSLERSLRADDDSALDLLRTRYETTFALQEKHRIAGMLLGRVSDDSMYWRELEHYAEDAVRFGANDEKTVAGFRDYCVATGVDPDQYSPVIWNALEIARRDPRSHALLLRTLESSDSYLVYQAISGLGEQHDLASLPAIEEALARLEDDPYVALALIAFQSEEVDAIAMKYLDEESLEVYRNDRAAIVADSLR